MMKTQELQGASPPVSPPTGHCPGLARGPNAAPLTPGAKKFRGF